MEKGPTCAKNLSVHGDCDNENKHANYNYGGSCAEEHSSDPVLPIPKKKNKKMTKLQRGSLEKYKSVAWTTEEENLMRAAFANCVINGKVPTTQKCQRILVKNQHVMKKHRSPAGMISWVSSEIEKRTRSKQIELEVVDKVQYNTVLTEVAATASSMSPDTNHNELPDNPDEFEKRMNGIHKEAAVPEEVLNKNNGLSMHTLQRVAKTGGTAEDVPSDCVSTKAAVGEQSEDEDKIQEYLQRSDTAVIYPEPVGRQENVPLTNGLTKEEDINTGSEYFIKCPQCQKGYQTFQSLKDHMESAHSDPSGENGSSVSAPSAVSPTPTLIGSGGPFGCSQCATSFSTKDQLEKHELLHSPNAQVSCKICNKTFANVYRLQRHMISHDESAVLRKFKCTECDKAFKFKHHLKEHIRIHSGEKPFECQNCGKRFSHSGSYSSHMTSKKCLVMNLKLGRTRAPSTNSSLLDKTSSQNPRGPKRPTNPLNNNITTSPNHNAFLPILPKYTEAAAAFLQSSLTNPTLPPFYIAPPGMLNAGHAISPYSMPSLGHLLEQLQGSSPLRPPVLETPESNPEDLKSNENHACSPKPEHSEDAPKPSTPNEQTASENQNEKDENNQMDTNRGSDLEAVKRILETVNATVTKQFLHANMQKFSETSSDCQSIASAHSPKSEHGNSKKGDDNEGEDTEVKSEGLAAKLEDALTTRSDEGHNGNFSSNEEDQEYDKERSKHDDYEVDSESVTTTDHLSEDGRKVRVRSLISDEQLKVLKDNYAINPRPKREELVKIASAIGFPVRVVQVWFQNTRARDRREGRLIQVPYSPSIPLRYSNLVPSNSQPLSHKMMPFSTSPNQYISEQPLDLSFKKEKGHLSSESSPASSPRQTASENVHSDSGEEVVNLSYKSSRSPTPFHHLPYQNHYQNSNSSEPHRTPSPADFSNSSRLAQILAQPAHKLSLPGMGLVPMERLIQFGAPDLPSLSQLITNRISSLSPNSEKRPWNDNGDVSVEPAMQEEDLLNANKRSKVSQYVLKGLGSPVLGSQENEVEGQFTCDQCDKAFSKQSSLARHKYEHSGQRPHKCDECPKAFKHKHHLTEHKRLHSGEKPFQCCKCLKRFSHSGSYSQHMNHRYSYCKPYRE